MVKKLTGAIIAVMVFFLCVFVAVSVGSSYTFSEWLGNLLNGGNKRERVIAVTVDFSETTDFRTRVSEDLIQAIKRYFIEYHNILGSEELSEEDTADNFEALLSLYNRDYSSGEIDSLIAEVMLDSRKADANYSECSLLLDLVSINFGDADFVEIRLTESFRVYLGDNSELHEYKAEHFFALDRRGTGKWLIKKHECDLSAAVYIVRELEKLAEADGYTISTVSNSTLETYIDKVREKLLK